MPPYPPPAPPPGVAAYPAPVNFGYVHQPPPTQYPVPIPPWAYIWDPALHSYYAQSAAYPPVGPAYERGGEGEGDYEFDVRRPAPRSMELFDPNNPNNPNKTSGSAPPTASARYYVRGSDGAAPELRRASSSDAVGGAAGVRTAAAARPTRPGGAISSEDELEVIIG
jgi:hypothetical protein